MKFESEKGGLFRLVYLAMVILMLSIFTIKITNDRNGFTAYNLIILAPALLLAWVWFGTSYTIDTNCVGESATKRKTRSTSAFPSRV